MFPRPDFSTLPYPPLQFWSSLLTSSAQKTTHRISLCFGRCYRGLIPFHGIHFDWEMRYCGSMYASPLIHVFRANPFLQRPCQWPHTTRMSLLESPLHCLRYVYIPEIRLAALQNFRLCGVHCLTFTFSGCVILPRFPLVVYASCETFLWPTVQPLS